MVMKVVVSDDKIVLYPWQLVHGMKLSCMRCSFLLCTGAATLTGFQCCFQDSIIAV